MFRRAARVGLVSLLLVAAGLAAAGLALTVGRGQTPAIVDGTGAPVPGSVAALEPVRLGGAEQWILVRGRDRAKPVLLFLHGGPGMPAMFLAHAWQRELERDFVIVHWDRRGAGRSFDAGAAPGSLTVRRTLDDLHELVGLLRARSGGEPIYLVGHSWGSYLGLLAVRERPDDYAAFVGTGQLAGTEAEVLRTRVELLRVRAATARDEELLARLETPGAVTEDDLFRHGGELHGARTIWPLLSAGLRAPEYGLRDVWNVKRGADRVGQRMRYDVGPPPHAGEVPGVAVPVFFFLGRHDLNTPPALAAAYLERLRAPLKRVEWFERSAHFPFLEEPAAFRAAMLRAEAEVRTLRRGAARAER